MPPESIVDRLYSTKSDVWSFGIVIIEIANQKEPYKGLDAVQVATKVAHGYTHPIPEGLNSFIADIIS
jgi:serine/threonine protein kinase